MNNRMYTGSPRSRRGHEMGASLPDSESLDSAQPKNTVIHSLRKLSRKQTSNLPDEPVRERLHDIMSPLNAVSGYVELLQTSVEKPGEADRLKRYSHKIAKGLAQISNQLEELQEFCRTHELRTSEHGSKSLGSGRSNQPLVSGFGS